MDVSSNTTTTMSGGGGGGGGKDRDKGKGASVSFTEGEKVLAYHGPLLYEAKMDRRSRLHRESSGRPRTGERPQNLYAKRRREKINDKLRVLQKLVPNGTKVDLSTMLEEAVLYVKFLQLRIKFAAAIPSFL
ncbi:Transcription factor bHLH85 [Hordeum vulgare]|nr:Transcription factor bHLH85 [Hordeum vulgare]